MIRPRACPGRDSVRGRRPPQPSCMDVCDQRSHANVWYAISVLVLGILLLCCGQAQDVSPAINCLPHCSRGKRERTSFVRTREIEVDNTNRISSGAAAGIGYHTIGTVGTTSVPFDGWEQPSGACTVQSDFPFFFLSIIYYYILYCSLDNI